MPLIESIDRLRREARGIEEAAELARVALYQSDRELRRLKVENSKLVADLEAVRASKIGYRDQMVEHAREIDRLKAELKAEKRAVYILGETLAERSIAMSKENTELRKKLAATTPVPCTCGYAESDRRVVHDVECQITRIRARHD